MDPSKPSTSVFDNSRSSKNHPQIPPGTIIPTGHNTYAICNCIIQHALPSPSTANQSAEAPKTAPLKAPKVPTTSPTFTQNRPVKLDLSCLERFVTAHKLMLAEASRDICRLLTDILQEVQIVSVTPWQEGDIEDEGDAESGGQKEEGGNPKNSKNPRPPKIEILKMRRKLAEEARPLVEELQARMRQAKETFLEEVSVECTKVGYHRNGPVLLNPTPQLNTEVMADRPRPRVCWEALEGELPEPRRDSGSVNGDLHHEDDMAEGVLKIQHMQIGETASLSMQVEDIEGVIEDCSKIPVAELDAFLEMYLAKRTFYVPFVSEEVKIGDFNKPRVVNIKSVRRFVEKKAKRNGEKNLLSGDYAKDDESLLRKVLDTNKDVRKAKAMFVVHFEEFKTSPELHALISEILETRRLQEASRKDDGQGGNSKEVQEAKRQMMEFAIVMTEEFCQQNAAQLAAVEAELLAVLKASGGKGNEQQLAGLREQAMAKRERARQLTEAKEQVEKQLARAIEEMAIRKKEEEIKREEEDILKKVKDIQKEELKLRHVEEALKEKEDKQKLKEEGYQNQRQILKMVLELKKKAAKAKTVDERQEIQNEIEELKKKFEKMWAPCGVSVFWDKDVFKEPLGEGGGGGSGPGSNLDAKNTN